MLARPSRGPQWKSVSHETLLSILRADVVGSTTLVRRDASLAHECIGGAFTRLSKTTSDYGRIGHEIGVGTLIAIGYVEYVVVVRFRAEPCQ
jgi:hypothetical protein